MQKKGEKGMEWKHIRVIPSNLYLSKTTPNRWVKLYQAQAVTLGET